MKQSNRLPTLGLLIVLCSFALGGCGGSSNGKRLTRAEFAAKATAICVSYNNEFNKDCNNALAAVRRGNIRADSAAKIASDKLISLGKKTVTDLEKLKPPVDEEATVKRAIALTEDVLALEAADAVELNKGDVRQATKLQDKMTRSILKSLVLFHALGVGCNMFVTPP